MSKLGYSRDGDAVTLTISIHDHAMLLLYLGMVVGAERSDDDLKRSVLALANRLNLGNPRWDRYDTEKHET